MLYFYCCEVKIQNKRTIQIDGCKPFNKKIESTEEFRTAQSFIKQDIFEMLLQQGKISYTDEINVHFNAFNPL